MSLVNLAAIKVLSFSVMIQIIYTIWGLYKGDVFFGIVYQSTAVEYLLVIDIFVEVHIII